MLKPLEQFKCDTCGGIIEKPSDGWFEWIHDKDFKCHSFRIVHQWAASPIKKEPRCYQHSDKYGRSDMHLDCVLKHLMPQLLYFLDLGSVHESKYEGPHVRDVREFAELARRLTLPYYEEARLYFQRAHSDGYFEGANEILIYTEPFLKELIESYT